MRQVCQLNDAAAAALAGRLIDVREETDIQRAYLAHTRAERAGIALSITKRIS
jgi:hypothetical protein